MSSAEPRTILLVEDEAIIAMATGNKLGSFGFGTITAYSGEQAIEKVREQRNIDLVLMDIDLGKGISGPQAAQEILSLRTIPIVFLTSHAEREMVERVRGITRYGYVLKNSGDFVLRSSIEMAFDLYEAEEHYRSIVENVNDALMIFDFEGTILDLNDNACRLLGFSRDEFLGKNLRMIKGEDGADAIGRQLQTLRRIDSLVFETLDRAKDGRFIPTEVSSKVISREGKGIIQSFTRDITERKRTAKELKDSEDKLQRIIANNNELICELDALGCYTYLSEGYERILGYKPEELLGAPAAELMHPEDIAAAMAKYEKVKGAKGPSVDEWRFRGKDGAYRVFECRSAVYADADGSIRTTVISHDITERKQAEAELRNREGQLTSVLEGTGAGIWDWDVSAGLVHIDRRTAAMLGQNPENLSSCTLDAWFQLKHPEDSMKSMDALQAHLRGESDQYSYESRMLHTSGRWIWILARGRVVERTAEGSPLRMFGIHLDISDQKRTEIALRENEERYRTIVENSGEGIAFVDAQENFIFANPAAEKVFGLPAGTIIGKNLSQLLSEDQFKLVKDETSRRSQGESSIYELEILRPNGERRIISVTAVPQKDALRGFVGTYGVFRDITGQKQTDEKIKALLAEKELILKEVHHRIKNNMGTIASLLNLQADSISDPSAKNALVDSVHRIQSMIVLYENLFQSMEINAVDAREYLETLARSIIDNFPHAPSVRLVCEIQPFALEARILQPLGIIINELLTNAMKYAFKGRSAGTICIKADRAGNRVSLELRDDGNTLPASIDFKKSTGFGLMLVASLTDQLHGNIRIERNEGTGIILEFDADPVL